MNIKNTILIFAFVLIGLTSASFASAVNYCPTDNGSGVVCSGGTPFYCGGSCITGAQCVGGWTPSPVCASGFSCTNVATADTCGYASTCDGTHTRCGAWPNYTCTTLTRTSGIPNCNGYNQCGPSQECNSCAGGYTICSSRNTSTSGTAGSEACVITKACFSGQTFDACSNTCVGTVTVLNLGYDSVSSSNAGTHVLQSANPILSVLSGGFVGINTTTPFSALSVSSGNIFINDSAITSGTPNAAVTKSYLDSALSAYSSANLWQLSGNNLFASTSTWNVGIGTTNPGYKLDVSGQGRFINTSSTTPALYVGISHPASGQWGNVFDMGEAGNGNLRLFTSNSGDKALSLWTNWSTTNSRWEAQAGTTVGSSRQQFGIDGSITFYTQPATLVAAGDPLTYNSTLRLNGNGNVGIGTTTPAAALDIFSKVKITSGGTIYNTDNSRYLDMSGILTDSLKVSGDIYTTAGEFKSDSAGVNYMLGSVGIGTSSPSLKLDVFGRGVFGTIASSRSSYGNTLSLANAGATDTSLFLWQNGTASGHIGFSASSNLLRIVNSTSDGSLTNAASINLTSTGLVGIGTTNPLSPLHVIGATIIQSGSGTGALVVGADAGLNTLTANVRKLGRIATPSYNNNYNFSVLSADSGNASVDGLEFGGRPGATTPSPTYISFSTTPTAGSIAGNAERMRIDTLGNVGIGTTTPDAKLNVNGTFHVTGSLNSVVLDKLTGTGNRIVMTDAGGSLYATSSSVATGLPSGTAGQTLRSDGTNWLANSVIYNDGTNVGIGTSSPAVKLDVLGNVRANGLVQALQIGGANYMFTMDAANGGGPRLQLGNLTTPAAYFEIGAWGGINNFDSKTRDLKLFTTNGLLYMTNTTGYIGIGTSTPAAALDIFSKVKITSGGTIYNTDSTRYLDMTGILTDSLKVSGDIYTTAGEFKSDGAGVNYMLGSVGIGTTTPTGAKLDVSGLIKMRVSAASITSAEDVINKAYLDSAISVATSSISGTGKFVTMTALKYSGDNTPEGQSNAGTGYTAANGLCNSASAGSHVCSSAEMLNSIALNVAMPVENSWVFNGPPGFTTSANDCNARTLGVTSVSVPNFGTYWEGTALGYSSGRGLLRTCDKYMKYACCK